LKLHQKQDDLAIVDLKMPDMDGPTTITKLKQMPGLKTVLSPLRKRKHGKKQRSWVRTILKKIPW
jgi:CheY-like chemotaxis protein